LSKAANLLKPLSQLDVPVDDFDDEDKVKIKGLLKAIGVPMQTKKLDKLRKNLVVQFK
jgi:hypothetical protein